MKTIYLMRHGMAIRRFLTAIKDANLKKEFIGNCGIVQLSYENGCFAVKQIINVNE